MTNINKDTSRLTANIDKYWHDHNIDALNSVLIDNDDFKNTRTQMLEMYGENKEIFSNYDENLAAHTINGTYVGKKDINNIVSWKGIPFAKQPVGDLRWRAPHKLDECNKVFEAYYFGKTSIQVEGKDEPSSLYPQGEDCLNLNIWNNTLDNSNSKPVMVWIHGGAYIQGGSCDPSYDGTNFVKNNPDVLFVTVDYRTDILGFINLSKVDGAKDYYDTANLGLLDQIAALSWLKENVKSFCGDPDRITLFGESAGAGSVSALMLAPQAKGMFKRSILQSGTSSSYLRTAQKSIEHTDTIMKISGAKNIDDLLSLSESDIRKIETILALDGVLDYTFPQCDDVVIPTDIKGALELNTRNGFDIMIGTTKDEYRYWTHLYGKEANMQKMQVLLENSLKDMNDDQKNRYEQFMSKQEGDEYDNLVQFFNYRSFHAPARFEADTHSNNGQNVYVYLFTEESNKSDLLSCHGFDLGFVFENISEKQVKDISAAYKLSKIMQRMWVNFAKCGDPSIKEKEIEGINSIEWNKYDLINNSVMILNSNDCHCEYDPIKDGCDLLNDLFWSKFSKNK